MMRIGKLFCTGVICSTLLLSACGGGAVEQDGSNQADSQTMESISPVIVDKCIGGNPIVGDSDNLIYGGDPSVLVDGETVYLYTGHDASTDEEVGKAIYNIPEYLCYSSTDMINWVPEGVVMPITWENGIPRFLYE